MTFPLFAPVNPDPLGRRRRLTGLSQAALNASENARAQVGLVPLPPLARNNDGIVAPGQAGGQWDSDPAGLINASLPRDTVGSNEQDYVSSLPNAVKRPDLAALFGGLQTPPTPPSLTPLPTRDRGREAQDTLKGAGILNLLALLAGRGDLTGGATGAFIGNAGQAYDTRAADDLQRNQLTNQQALQDFSLRRQAVGDANDIVTQRANTAIQQGQLDQRAYDAAIARQDRNAQNHQLNALKRDEIERKAAHDKAVESAKKIGSLFSFAARAGGRLTPDGEAALSQAIKDAGGAENLPMDFIAQLSDAEKAAIQQKDNALKAQLYGIDTRDARAAAGQEQTGAYRDALLGQGERRLAQGDQRIGIQQGREARLSAPGASGKIDGFTPNQVETQRRMTQGELTKLTAQKQQYMQYAEQARTALATNTMTDAKGNTHTLTTQERAGLESTIQQMHRTLPGLDAQIQDARGRLGEWQSRSDQSRRASQVGGEGGADTTPSQLEQFIGRNTGPNGCARAVCQIAKGLGIPVPQTESAGEMEKSLQRGVQSGAWVQVPVGQAQAGDVVVGHGEGPSGRHVTVATGDGRTIGNPGKRSGYKITYRPLPAQDRSAVAYRYVGASNGSPALAERNVTPRPVPNGPRPAQHRAAATGQYAKPPVDLKAPTGDLLQRLADKYKESSGR